jgi:hypothetical protein
VSDCRGETTNKQSGEPRRRVGPRGGGAGGRVTHRATSATETTYLTSMTHSVCMCVCRISPFRSFTIYFFPSIFHSTLFLFSIIQPFFYFVYHAPAPFDGILFHQQPKLSKLKMMKCNFSRNFITKLKMFLNYFSKKLNAQFKQAKCQSKYFF